jgi:preprotein translocase subunit SecG
MFETVFSLNTFWWVCTIIWFPSCVGLVLVVLMQKGKGAGFAGAFGGGGGSETVFGPRARKSLPVRLTYIMAGTFMLLSLLLSLIVGRISVGVAPGEVEEDAAVTATNSALNTLFGEKAGAEAPGAAGAIAPAAAGTDAPAATPEAAPAAATEAAPAPAVQTPAPESAPAPASAGQ